MHTRIGYGIPFCTTRMAITRLMQVAGRNQSSGNERRWKIFKRKSSLKLLKLTYCVGWTKIRKYQTRKTCFTLLTHGFSLPCLKFRPADLVKLATPGISCFVLWHRVLWWVIDNILEQQASKFAATRPNGVRGSQYKALLTTASQTLHISLYGLLLKMGNADSKEHRAQRLTKNKACGTRLQKRFAPIRHQLKLTFFGLLKHLARCCNQYNF